ncbi:MAG: choice-of-anchor L domain-containing protein [Methylovulum sp.]|nr:choice-of-anchor L domain-containing protein [Methylovulum sp.]
MTTTTIIPPTSVTGSVSGGFAGSGNYYNFTVTSTSIYTFKTTPRFTEGVSKGDSDLTLFQIINGSPVFKSDSTGITGETDVINVVLTAGDYQLQTLPFIGSVDYLLTATFIEQFNQDYSDFGLNKSYSLGKIDWNSPSNSSIASSALPDHQLVADTGTIIDFLNHKGDMDDAYSFTVNKPTKITLTLTPDANSNVDLALYDDHNTQIKGSFNDTGETDTLTADIKPGTYWVDASFVSTSNEKVTSVGSNFIANYDLSISSAKLVLPTTQFRAFNGNAAGLAETFNFNNSTQPETIAISNAKYSGITDQAAIVNNFAGSVNAGVLLTTGSAKDILGHVYNQKQGVSTSDAETVKNWSNKGGTGVSMQPLGSAGDKAGYNAQVFKAVSDLVTEQNKVLDAAHQIDPITAVYDAASLSFDVAVTGKGNYLSFDLLFASEEYALFADKYVDSAVIIVDGKNYALFDPKNAESLLSVTQTNVDANYFYDNTQLADGASVYPTEFNGVSRLISVMAPIDTTLATHHVSIAIADTNDHVLDSGIFLTNLDSVDLHRPTIPGVTPPTLVGREGLYAAKSGTDGNDVMAGTEGRDLSMLGVGNDTIDTGAGNDVVVGGQGNDSIEAGAGNDLLDGGTGNDNMDGGAGADQMVGGVGADSLYGGENNDIIQGGDATDRIGDTLDGGTGKDTVAGAGGADTITGGTDAIGDSLSGGAGNDVISDAGGNDTILAGAGNDNVTSGAGNDTLDGGTGNDKMAGGLGNDVICGCEGNDVLTGGAGQDTFEMDSLVGTDTITDFSPLNDTITLENSIFAALNITGTLSLSGFEIGASATDANTHVIYDNTTGQLSYDPDGNGVKPEVQIAVIGIDLSITNADFAIV